MILACKKCGLHTILCNERLSLTRVDLYNDYNAPKVGGGGSSSLIVILAIASSKVKLASLVGSLMLA